MLYSLVEIAVHLVVFNTEVRAAYEVKLWFVLGVGLIDGSSKLVAFHPS